MDFQLALNRQPKLAGGFINRNPTGKTFGQFFNDNDLLVALLTVEKGSTAKIMIETIDMHDPNEVMYTREHVSELLKPLETDYYGRYEFDDLQKMMLENRRLRMNYWISKVNHKPIEKFKNPNLLKL